MARSRYVHTVDGQEVNEDDLNNMSDNAGLAQDHVLAELLRPAPYVAGVTKFVMPWDVAGNGTDSAAATVVPSGAADGKIKVMPCRIGLGSRDTVANIGEENWADARSGLALGSNPLAQSIQLDPTVANNRVDLVYARIDVDLAAAGQSRFVKTPTAPAAAQTISVRQECPITLGVVKGAEGVTPARPALPADGAGAYYVPLAYVFLSHPFTGAVPVDETAIHEVMNVLPLSRGVSGVSASPVDGLFKVGGCLTTLLDFVPGGRPDPHLPPTMQGAHLKLIPWDGLIMPPGATTVIDESMDWRKRGFLWFAQAGGDWAWAGSSPPDLTPSFYQALASNFGVKFMMYGGQSFKDDGTASCGLAGGVVAVVTATNLSALAGSSSIHLVARASDGKLCAVVSATNPGIRVFFWVLATGPYGNA